MVQRSGIALRKAPIDHLLEPLADDQKAAGGNHQRQAEEHHALPVGPRELQQDPQRAQALDAAR